MQLVAAFGEGDQHPRQGRLKFGEVRFVHAVRIKSPSETVEYADLLVRRVRRHPDGHVDLALDDLLLLDDHLDPSVDDFNRR